MTAQKVEATLVIAGGKTQKVRVPGSHKVRAVVEGTFSNLAGTKYTVVAKGKELPENATIKPLAGQKIVVVPQVKSA